MQAVKEFWVGLLAAALGASVGFASVTFLNRSGTAVDIATFILVTGGAGFLVGATATQIWHEGVRRWLSQLFGIDTRSLAVLRIGLAVAILIDLWMRVRDLTAHYSDDGILPLEINFYRPSALSLHLLSGDAWVQLCLFIVAVPFAVLMLVGYRTRLMTVICWFLLLSLQCRNPTVSTGGDTLLRMMMFWCMFLPLGARYSVDSALNVSLSKRRYWIVDAATFALLVQFACMYCFSGVLKTDITWRVDGSASYYALSLEMLTTSLGQYLLNFPRMLRAGTFFVIYLELFAPLLIFFPWRNAAIRTLLFFILFGMHLGFQMTMFIGVFPMVAMVATFSYLPSGVWNRLQTCLKNAQPRGVAIYYDWQCTFCRKMALLIRTALVLLRVRIRRSNVDPEIADIMQQAKTWVVVDADGNRHVRFDGLLTLLRTSVLFRPLAWLLALQPFAAIGDWCYRFVARHRKLFGKLASIAPIRSWRVRPYWPVQPLIIAFLIYIVLYNFISLPGWDMSWFTKGRQLDVFGKRIEVTPKWVYNTGRHLRLDQNWKLFAPKPLMGDGWFVAEGTLADGSTVEARSGGAVHFDKPDYVAYTYPNNRWRKFMEKLRRKNINPRFQLEYCKYLCRQWNLTHNEDQQLQSVRLYFMYELSRPPHIETTAKKVELKSCDCSMAWRSDRN